MSSDAIDAILGIDRNDPSQVLAMDLVKANNLLIDELIVQRLSQCLTQEEVALRMGVSPGAVARMESGDRDPRLSTLGRYAHAIGVMVTHEVSCR